ncbi:hypothetical protein [Clostridium cylindrosporum]|uniref:Glycosyltransferase n=1 Tax=Clostridium cylindrosporum DSM 605 TaxID=1121307 RepID=A0A0J8D8R1_CLOCY|nr:hypothetical protein [Clostridium cylindrosporum]KMT22267.1 hypothetical protein CLCY_4c02400 [Clostridium cylindrosporum DSM 605]
MKKITSSLLALLFIAVVMVVPNDSTKTTSTTPIESHITKSQCKLRTLQRKLWSDHVIWTRDFIVSDLASLEDTSTVLQRLLRNQDDIGNSIKPYYGEEAGNTLSKLLREHIEIAGQVVNAAKTNNKLDLDKYNKLWYQNADKIADFLSSANPNLSNKELKDMLHKHLEFVTNEAVSRLNKDWNSDIETFDKGYDHMLMFADTISKGIIKQFPDKFK